MEADIKSSIARCRQEHDELMAMAGKIVKLLSVKDKKKRDVKKITASMVTLQQIALDHITAEDKFLYIELAEKHHDGINDKISTMRREVFFIQERLEWFNQKWTPTRAKIDFKTFRDDIGRIVALLQYRIASEEEIFAIVPESL